MRPPVIVLANFCGLSYVALCQPAAAKSLRGGMMAFAWLTGGETAWPDAQPGNGRHAGPEVVKWFLGAA